MSSRLYRPAGHRDQGVIESKDRGDYVYHTRDPRVYTLVPATGQQPPPLAPVAGPVFAHELHLWCHTALLDLWPEALETLLLRAVRRCVEEEGRGTEGWSEGLKSKAKECLAGLSFVERCGRACATHCRQIVLKDRVHVPFSQLGVSH